jgi:hypothetical protein
MGTKPRNSVLGSTENKMKRRRIIIEGEQAVRLEELARRWGTTPTEALRRALDQAFVGRGAMVALHAGLIFLENMEFKKPTELKPKEKPDPLFGLGRPKEKKP